MSTETIEQTFWQKTKRFLSPFTSDRWIYLIAIFTYVLSSLNIIAYVLFLERVLYVLESWTKQDFYNTIYIFLCYYAVYLFLKVVLRKKWWPAHATTARKYVQRKYLPKFFQLDNNELEKLWTWKVIAILDKGITVWGNLFHHFFEEWTRVLVSVIFTAYMVWKNSTTLLWIFVFLYVLIYICSFYFNIGTLKYRRRRRDWWNTHTKHLVKLIMSKNEVLFTNKAKMEIDKLDFYYDKETSNNRKMADYLMPMFELPRIIVTGLLVFVLYYFWGLYLEWNLQISQVVGLSTTFIIMLSAINAWVQFFKNFTKDFTEVEKIWEFFDTTPQIEWYDVWDDFVYKNGKIELRDVDYGYDESKPVFQNFSLDIPGNKIIALVWPSWGWKSTLVKLISGYIRQNSWNIFVDDQSLKDVSLKSYYRDVWYLTQEPSVFDGSVRENLLYAVGDEVKEEKMNKIISLAHCEFIYDLPNGLDTEIWERWVKLSWGQKQRLAIAKIFLKNPKIIILDEPTSALDSLSEKKITSAMHNLFHSRTVLVIAHRLQTVKHADDIIVIDKGEVIERGRHSELVKQKWFYKQMLDLQSGF